MSRPTRDQSAVVEYRLMRDVQMARVLSGAKAVEDLCDAQSELLRVANNLGKRLSEQCPLCHDDVLREVLFLFGPKMPASGLVPASRAEFLRFQRGADVLQCYAVEVCVACKFNHLARRFAIGGTASSRSNVARS